MVVAAKWYIPTSLLTMTPDVTFEIYPYYSRKSGLLWESKTAAVNNWLMWNNEGECAYIDANCSIIGQLETVWGGLESVVII